MGLDMKTKKKLTEETAKRYCRAGKKQKSTIIDEFTATTGYKRKYAIHILKNAAKIKITHFNNVEKKSVQVLDYFSTKFGYSEEMKHKLSKILSATIGRMISPEISKYSIRGISTTRPAKNLNKLIPIRVYFEWDTLEPGFFEADTVANCGMSTEGQYISTLKLTDVFSGWTENRALLNKAQRWVKEAVDDVKKKLPFQMKGLDSDNGSELKNTQLLGWCQENHVEFTRSRPYRKNDNCYVEQKNDSVVRRIVGYYRFEGEEARAVMAELYETYNLLVNYFFPSMKIQKKERIDAKVTKKYDDAKTPYTRLIECESLPEEAKQELRRRKNALDLETLLQRTQELQTKLIALAVPWSK